MLGKPILSLALVALLGCAVPLAAHAADEKAESGEKKPEGDKKKPAKAGEAPLPSNEIKATVPGNYVQVPLMRLAVTSDANRRYRMLEVEVWLTTKDPITTAVLGSNKKKISAALKEDLAAYNWEAFSQHDTGVEIAKNVVRNAVQRSLGIKPDEVIMRSLILR